MNQANHKVRKIYEAALDKLPQQRAAYLDRVCGANGSVRNRVERLLKAREELGDFLGEPTRGRELPEGVQEVAEVSPARRRVEEVVEEVIEAAPVPGSPDEEAGRGEGPGTVIERYKLLQKIGEGGFGVVYMAAQSKPVKRKVALKIIKLGMDTDQVVARFEAERQALALMDHPNIAKVLDGGATKNGRPYFVMELVRGVPITEYCDTARLDTRERLDLFRKVCHAVQHAHQKGIIHRDLKPSNLLVTLHDGRPVPKVIDFGIAKAMDRTLTEKTLFTQFHQMIGTPEYMAPEQAELSGLDVDTRADIYSLGVLLYELLTGTKPFDLKRLLDKGYDEILRTIREEDPPRPSTRVSTLGKREIGRVARGHDMNPKQLGGVLRGDLDWIVMKALEKDRSRRYETANAFAADIQRHLDDQPVLASPPTPVYRMRKYFRRHRVGVVTAAVVAVALVAGTASALWGWKEASDGREAAENSASSERAAKQHEAKQRDRAEKGEQEANRQRIKAEEAGGKLERALRRSEGIRLSALSQTKLARNPTLALLLAIEGASLESGAYANKGKGTAGFHAWSPDDSRIVTGSMTGVLKVFDPQTGKALHAVETGHGLTRWVRWYRGRVLACLGAYEEDVRAVLISWDPATGETQRLTSTDGVYGIPLPPRNSFDSLPIVDLESGTVALIALDSGRITRTFKDLGAPHNGGIYWPKFSPNNTRFVWRSWQTDECRLHDGETGTLITKWPVVGVRSCAFSADGKWIASVETEERITVRDAVDGTLICALNGQGSSGGPVFSPDGRRVVTTRGAARIWDARTGALLRDLDFPIQGDGQVSRDGSTLVAKRLIPSGLEFWSLLTGRRVHRLPGDSFPGALAADRRVVAGLNIIDPEPAGRRSLRMLGRARPSGFVMHPDGWHVVSIGAGRESTGPRLWDLRTRRPVQHFDGHGIFINTFRNTMMADGAFSPDGSTFVSAGGLGEINIWDGLGGERRRRLDIAQGTPGRQFMLRSVEFSPDGRTFAVAGQDPRVRVYDLQTGRLAFRIGDEFSQVPRSIGGVFQVTIGGSRNARFSPDGKRVLTFFTWGTPRVYDLATKHKLFELSVGDQDRWVLHAGYSPDGRWIRVASIEAGDFGTGKTHLFEAESGDLVQVLEGIHAAMFFPSGFDARGERILTSVPAEGVRIYEVKTAKLLMKLRTPGESPSQACFSPDERWILAISTSRDAIYVWDAHSGRLVHHLTDGRGTGWSFSSSAAFTNDSRHLLMVTKDHVLRVLPLDLLSAAIELRPRDLTPEEVSAYEVPRSSRKAPRAWRRPNGTRDRITREAQIHAAEKKLREFVRGIDFSEPLKQFAVRMDYGTERDVSWAVGEFANDLLDAGHIEAATAAYRFAVAEALPRFGERHSYSASIQWSLIRQLMRMGRASEIGPLLDRYERAPGQREDRVPFARGVYLTAKGKPKEAKALLQKAYDYWDDFISGGSQGEIQQAMAAAMIDLGEYEDAEVLLDETAAFPPSTTSGSPGGNYLDARVCIRRYIKLYTKWKKPKKLTEWRKNLADLETKYHPARKRDGNGAATSR